MANQFEVGDLYRVTHNQTLWWIQQVTPHCVVLCVAAGRDAGIGLNYRTTIGRAICPAQIVVARGLTEQAAIAAGALLNH